MQRQALKATAIESDGNGKLVIDETVITGVVRGIIVSLFPMAITIITLAWKNYKANKANNKTIEQVKTENKEAIGELEKKHEKALGELEKRFERMVTDYERKLNEVVTENVRLADTSREYRLSFEAVNRNNSAMYQRIASLETKAGTLEVKAVEADRCKEKLSELEEENTLLKARVGSLEKLGGL